jgi:hypothetical protein
MQYSKKLSYPQRTFSAIFGQNLLYLLLIEEYEKQATKITDEFLEKFINDLCHIDHDKDMSLIKTIIDMIYKKGLKKEDVINLTGLDEETVQYHHAYMLRKMRYPSVCKPYRQEIISLLK